jgi:hypothetical protein
MQKNHFLFLLPLLYAHFHGDKQVNSKDDRLQSLLNHSSIHYFYSAIFSYVINYVIINKIGISFDINTMKK